MKYCFKCGTPMDDSSVFCPSCGTQNAAASFGAAPVPVPAPKPTKSKAPLAWAGIIAAFLVVAIVISCSFGLFDDLFYGNNSSIRDRDDDDDDDDRQEPATPEEITIKVWTPTEDQAEGNNWLTTMQARFDELHPEWNVVWENSTMGEGDAGYAVYADVTASADVYMYHSDQMNSLIQAGGLAKVVGEYKTQVLRDNNEFMINTVTYTDGEIYGFPMTNNTWFMYYDKTVFTENDVKNLDTMLTKGKVCLPFGTGWTAGCIFLGCGGTIFGENGLDAEAGINFGGANGYMAARKMIQLKEHPNAVCGDMDVSKLINGEVDATFSGSWEYNSLERYLGDNLGVAMLPTFTIDGWDYQMTAMSASKCVGVNPNCGTVEGKQEIATAFAAFLASEEAQLARYEMRGVTPACQNLRNNEQIKANPVAVAEMDTIRYASVLQSPLPAMSNYWGPVENFGSKVCTGDTNLENYVLAVDEMQESLNYWW